MRAVFGFPLQVGSVRLGAFNLYCDRPGPLSDEQHADALVMGRRGRPSGAGHAAGAPPGALAAELEAGAEFQYVVHQASGMVSAQSNASVGQALIRLRAYAFGHDRRLAQVAEDVVSRRLRFDAGSVSKTRDRDTTAAMQSAPRPARPGRIMRTAVWAWTGIGRGHRDGSVNA